jgi:hypothetical protein
MEEIRKYEVSFFLYIRRLLKSCSLPCITSAAEKLPIAHGGPLTVPAEYFQSGKKILNVKGPDFPSNALIVMERLATAVNS